ncbi:MAG: hypothetical protein LC137_04970 [Burkholderiales bacterium]|nr:hypothetical protein [Burkholderiales bacterium]
MMHTATRLALALAPLLLAACAATPPPARDFPAGARAPSAAELTTLLRGKSFDATAANGTPYRTQFAAAGNAVTVFFSGRSDSGTWRAEDGRVCYEFPIIPSSCGDYRLVGQDLYIKRANGDVVQLIAR